MAQKLFIPIDGLDDTKLMQGAKRAVERLKTIFKEGFTSIKDLSSEVTSGQYFLPEDSPLADTAANLKNTILEIKDALKQTTDESSIDRLNLDLQDTEDELSDVKTEIRHIAAESIKLGSQKLFGGGINMIGTGVGKVLTGFKQLWDTKPVQGFRKIFNRTFGEIRKGAKQGGNSIKRMMMAMLGARSLFTVISKATHAYMAANEELNEKLQGIWNSLGELIGPVIEYIINLVVKLFGYINSFVQALTGINMVANANAKALKKQAEAQKGLNAQTAAFDEMNKLSDGGGNSAPQLDVPDFNVDVGKLGEGLADKINEVLAGIDWEKIFNTVKEIVGNIVYQLNQFILNLDWGLLGQTFANGLNTILLAGYIFVTQFDWVQFGGSLAQLISNLITNIDWEMVGATLVGFIQGLINFAIGWLANFDYTGVGQTIGALIRGIFENLDFSWIVAGLYGLINAVHNFFTGLFESLGFDETTVKVFAGLATSIMIVVGAIAVFNAIMSLATIAGGLLSIAIGAVNVVLGILGGIISFLVANPIVLLIAAIVGIVNWLVKAATGFDFLGTMAETVVNWIKDKWKGIGDWFKEKFGIAKDSGEEAFEEIADKSDSSKKQIDDIWSDFDTKLGTEFTNVQDTGEDVFKNLNTASTTNFNDILKTVQGNTTDMSSLFGGLKTNVSDSFNNLGNVGATNFDALSENAKIAWQSIQETFSKMPEWFETKFTEAWTKVKDVFSTGGQIFSGIKEGIESSFKTIINKIIDGLNTIISKPFSRLNSILNDLQSVTVGDTKPFSGRWGWSPISVPQIPRLAQGAVIPPNKEFMAILGDQKSGMNIEAPLDTIVDAFRQVLAENNGQALELTVKLDGKTLSRELTKATKKLDFSYNRG